MISQVTSVLFVGVMIGAGIVIDKETGVNIGIVCGACTIVFWAGFKVNALSHAIKKIDGLSEKFDNLERRVNKLLGWKDDDDTPHHGKHYK